MAKKYIKGWWTSLVIGKCRLKTQWCTITRLFKWLKLKTDHSKCWQGRGGTRIPIEFWWKCFLLLWFFSYLYFSFFYFFLVFFLLSSWSGSFVHCLLISIISGEKWSITITVVFLKMMLSFSLRLLITFSSYLWFLVF